MDVDSETGDPWTRKHDDPRRALIEHAGLIVYPKTLTELRDVCRNPSGARLKAAGSHWALSAAAVSGGTFIETHDPAERHQAMGRTLGDVIPDCLNREYVRRMVFLSQQGEAKWSLVHVEAGKRIYQLYAELDQVADVRDVHTLAGFINVHFGDDTFAGPWAFETLGGAGGQTVVGAISTGTHGGDFDLPPLADSVLAIHLVVDGVKHYWIEPDTPDVPRLTDDDALNHRYGLDFPNHFAIKRDTDLFNAVLVSAGRFGAIYSVVLKAVPQYALVEKRRLHLWQDIKHQITDRGSPLYHDGSPPGFASTLFQSQRFLQVAVSLTTHLNFQQNLVGVTKRWSIPMIPGIPGHAERVGERVGGPDELDPMTQSPKFARAGASHAFSPDSAHPEKAKPPTMLELACSDASFVRGIVRAAIDEIRRMVETDGAEISVGIAAIAAVGAGGLLLLLAAFALILVALAEIIDALDGRDPRFGEAMEFIKNRLLNPPSEDPLTKAAGLFAWQLIFYKAFSSQQSDQDFAAVSYAVMDAHDYLDTSCNVNVDSVEIFFDAEDLRMIAFIDALIAFEMEQEFHGKAFVGYASMRFSAPTRALLGMQRYSTTCSVEIACLKDVSGGHELIDFAIAWASNPNVGGILHWGQRNDWTRAEVERVYTDATSPPGDTLTRWRAALEELTEGREGFSSDFTRRLGLEVR